MKTSSINRNMFVLAALVLAGVVSADEVTKEGYVLDSSGEIVRSGYGLCWRSAFWTSAVAIVECDPDLVKVAEVAPEPAAPAPAAVPQPTAEIVITLQSDTLFAFDSSVIRAEARNDLDTEVVSKMKNYPQIERVLVTGHADRIGSPVYNQKLSQRRADAVKAYLVEQGIDADRIQAVGKGESEPLVACDEIKGKVSSANKELVECLKPNRRVDVEIKNR